MRLSYFALLVLAVPAATAATDTSYSGSLVCADQGACSGQITLNSTANATLLIQIDQWAGYAANSVGVWQFDLTVDDTAVGNCTYYLQTSDDQTTLGDGTTHRGQFYQESRCAIPHTYSGAVWFNVTRSTASGSPASLDDSKTTITLHTQAETTPTGAAMSELIEAVNLTLPLVFFVGLLVWAEVTKSMLIYIVAALAGALATIAIWADVESMRVIVLSATVLVIARAAYEYEHENTLDEQ